MTALSAVAAALIVVSSMLVPAPAQAARSADLVVSSVTGTTGPATTGKTFTLKAKVRNAGRRSAKASTAGVYLGWDDKLDLGKAELLGQFKVSALGGGKSKTSKPKLTIPLDAPVGRAFHLVVCADDAKKIKESSESNNCTAASDLITLQGAPTVLGQIDEDVASGEIDEATGLLYYAYSATGDPRLPDSYGPLEPVFDSPLALWKVADRFGDLSAASQAALDPFFSPPSYAGGYLPPAAGSRRRAQRRAALGPSPASCIPGGIERPASSGWASMATTHFRIWYFTADPGGLAGDASTPAQSQAAATALAAIAENVYTKEGTLWRAPLSDAGTPCNGGDGLIDVYSARLSSSAKAQVIPHPPGSNLRPGWMWVAPDVVNSDAKARSYFAHEFAHLTQLAYNESADPAHGTRIEYGWLEEASATWAMDFVYPADNLEHEFATRYYDGRSWQTELGECELYGCGNGYRDYLFFFFLSHKLGNSVMSGLWNSVESNDSIAAVKDAVGGDFSTEWRNFALYDMNRENYKQYTTWDGIPDQLPLADDGPVFPVTLGGAAEKTTPYPHAAEGGERLGAKTFGWVSFGFGDDQVKKFTIKDFGFQSASSNTKVTAWYKLANGQTGILDLTGETQHSWCLDEDEQDLSELIVFYTDGRPTPYLEQTEGSYYPKASGKVIAEDACSLPETFTGTFAGNVKRYNPLHDTWSGSVSFEFDSIYNGDPDDLVAYYQVSGGSVNWTANEITADANGCKHEPDSPQTSALHAEQGDGLYLYIDRDPIEYEIKVSDSTDDLAPMPVDVTCPTVPGYTYLHYPPWDWTIYTYEYETSPYTTNDAFNIADSFDDDDWHLAWALSPGSLDGLAAGG